MVYDSAREKIVLFGGSDAPYGGNRLNDTWELDGNEWIEVDEYDTAPYPRYGHTLAF